jgi:hypothetical protein
MTQPHDDETADEKFENFEKALKQVLTAPKPPLSGNGENSTESEPRPT